MGLKRLVLEACDPATGECSRRTYEVDEERYVDATRAEVERLVAHAHPHAELRAFAPDEATFEATGLQITVRELAAPRRSRSQDQLFAA